MLVLLESNAGFVYVARWDGKWTVFFGPTGPIAGETEYWASVSPAEAQADGHTVYPGVKDFRKFGDVIAEYAPETGWQVVRSPGLNGAKILNIDDD